MPIFWFWPQKGLIFPEKPKNNKILSKCWKFSKKGVFQEKAKMLFSTQVSLKNGQNSQNWVFFGQKRRFWGPLSALFGMDNVKNPIKFESPIINWV